MVQIYETSGDVPPGTDGTDVNWADLLAQSRNLQKECAEKDDPPCEEYYSQVRLHFPHLRDLLREYCTMLDGAAGGAVVTVEEKKKLVLKTRAALRLALSCSSLKDSETRNRMVNEAVVQAAWHDPLVYLLSHSKGDAKCRVLGSQLLSNLVTSHYDAAQTITAHLPISPSKDSVDASIRESISSEESPFSTIVEPTWVDMMLACAHSNNRQALTGTIAALHNALLSLGNTEIKPNNPQIQFASNVASNEMLVSTLLRQIISMHSMKQAIEKMKDADGDAKGSLEKEEESLADAATEWISFVLVKCCKLGFLSNLIASAGGTTADQLAVSELRLVPEHVVLLQCLRSEMESPQIGKDSALLGGEAGSQSIIETHLFLATLYNSLRQRHTIDSITASEGQADPEIALNSAAIVTILEIQASSLAQDSPSISSTRVKLGEIGCSLLQDSARDLGTLVDSISARNSGRKSREFYMSDEEKSAMTALVQLIGNACFQCRQNQDLIRSTVVPNSRILVIPSDDGNSEEERNGLHVVLSCTSLAHTCFTLREWAVVAIRNLLDNNELNQAVVESLEANQPVQSAELGDLGIKVNLDPKGNVSVEPTDKKPTK